VVHGVHDVITGNNFIKIGQGVYELQGPKIGVSHWLALSPLLTTVRHYRADYDLAKSV